MFLKIVFTSFIINSLCFLSEGRIELNQTRMFLELKSEIDKLKLEHTFMEEDQQKIKADQVVIKDDLTRDNGLVQEELTRLKTEQSNLLSMINVLKDKIKASEAKKGRSCAEVLSRSSGIYEILIPSYSDEPFKVYCDAGTHGGDWTVILRRMDGSVDFYRDWSEYKSGFGDMNGEFFLGLDKIHAITKDQPQELLVILEDFSGTIKYEAYDAFAIGDESDSYKLNIVGDSSGSAGDSFTFHKGMYFSTHDRDNDKGDGNCAVHYHGGWWFKECHKCYLTGTYNDDRYGMGVNWYAWRGYHYSLKRAVMMIRPKKI